MGCFVHRAEVVKNHDRRYKKEPHETGKEPEDHFSIFDWHWYHLSKTKMSPSFLQVPLKIDLQLSYRQATYMSKRQ
jgi:hypothetical protein